MDIVKTERRRLLRIALNARLRLNSNCIMTAPKVAKTKNRIVLCYTVLKNICRKLSLQRRCPAYYFGKLGGNCRLTRTVIADFQAA